MSENLSNSVALLRSASFVDLVRAAMVERALQLVVPDPDTPATALARTVLYDPGVVDQAFARVVADDPAISTSGSAPEQDDVRRVVSDTWDTVAAAVPNLGA